MPGEKIIIGSLRGVPIGQGGFATVYRVIDSDRKVFALKLVDPFADEAIRESLYHEFSVQSELIHPQVAHAHAFGVYDGRPYIVLDWIDGAELFEYFRTPTADDFVAILRQIASALLFVHHRGWVHGDLKPENFRWRMFRDVQSTQTDPQLCLLDFGLARPAGDANRPRGAGTIGYCAPEFLNSLPADGRADWYAVGVILYEWIFGMRPYAADEPAIEITGHLEGVPDFDSVRQRPAPSWADEVIRRLLAKTADERADDEIALLNWLAEYDSGLEHSTLLNEQLGWHARSESVRLRPHEIELLKALRDELASGHSAIWSITSHGIPSGAWMSRAAGLCSLMGYEVDVDRRGDGSVVLDDHSLAVESDARVRIMLSPNMTSDEPPQPLRRLSLLQWDRDVIQSFLKGVVGDEGIAAAWTDTIHKATCGLPAAVSKLIEHQIESGNLSVDADGWGLDEQALKSWRGGHMPGLIADVFGELSQSERRLLEWLAIGEGVGALAILQGLWNNADDELEFIISALENRGLIVRSHPVQGNSFDLRLRLIGHDSILRDAMSPLDVSERSRVLAGSVAANATNPESTRAWILGHAFARAAVWDKSAEECLRTASFAIASDDRERAMRYIVKAQESARQIEDTGLRNHWVGHARMVEGDLQKATGQLDVARRIYRELLALCRTSGDQRLLAETLHDLANLYYVTRRYDKGIRSERRALRIWESLGDRGQISRSLNSLGNLHWIASDLLRAREFYHRALGIQRALGFDSLAAINLNNLGLIYWKEHDFSEAKSHFQQAVSIQYRLGVPVEVARGLNNLGAISFEQGLLGESSDYFARAASLNAEAGAQSEELFNRWNLVEVALESGDLRTAVTLGQQVLHACSEIGEHATAAEVSALLADAYYRAGDDRRARSFYEDCRRASATLKNDDLKMHLDLHQAASHNRFRNFAAAMAILESVSSPGHPPTNRYRYLDSLILRAQVAVALGDAGALLEAWRLGSVEADAIAAPQKKAQLAVVCVTGDIEQDLRDQLSRGVLTFLTERRRWHWAAAFYAWQARVLMDASKLDDALELITGSVDQLRRDGCWEQLWRSLVLQAEICHTQADYEPALRGLDEAARMLKVVSSTVDDESERSRYLDCDDARTLERIKERITQLVA